MKGTNTYVLEIATDWTGLELDSDIESVCSGENILKKQFSCNLTIVLYCNWTGLSGLKVDWTVSDWTGTGLRY